MWHILIGYLAFSLVGTVVAVAMGACGAASRSRLFEEQWEDLSAIEVPSAASFSNTNLQQSA